MGSNCATNKELQTQMFLKFFVLLVLTKQCYCLIGDHDPGNAPAKSVKMAIDDYYGWYRVNITIGTPRKHLLLNICYARQIL